MIKRAFQFVRCSEAPCASRAADWAQFLVDGNSPRRHTLRSRSLLLGFERFQIIVCLVIAMAKNKIVAGFSDQNLAETKRNSFEGLLDGMFHRWGAT